MGKILNIITQLRLGLMHAAITFSFVGFYILLISYANIEIKPLIYFAVLYLLLLTFEALIPFIKNITKPSHNRTYKKKDKEAKNVINN